MKQGFKRGASRWHVESRPPPRLHKSPIYSSPTSNVWLLIWSFEIIQGHCKTISRRLKITWNVRRAWGFNMTACFSAPCADCCLFSVYQVRWHGAKNNRWEGVWVHMLAEWGAGHRLAGPCDRVKLQPHLPPKPAGGETPSPKGTASPPHLSVCLLPFFLSVSLFSFYLPPLSLSYPHVTERWGKHYFPEC